MNSNQLLEKIENSNPIDFGDIFSKSFNLYQKVFSKGIVHALILIAISIPLIIIIYIPVLPVYIEMIQNSGNPSYRPTFFEDFSLVAVIVWFIVIFVLSFVMQVFNVSVYGHFLKVLRNEETGNNEEIGGYFTIAKDHFGKILLLTLASTGIGMLAALACYLPIFYVLVPLQLLIPIFVFNPEISNSDIIKVAFKLGNKYWLVFFGLIFVSGLFAMLGSFLCGIGVIMTVFFPYIVTFYMYKETIGFDDKEESERWDAIVE